MPAPTVSRSSSRRRCSMGRCGACVAVFTRCVSRYLPSHPTKWNETTRSWNDSRVASRGALSKRRPTGCGFRSGGNTPAHRRAETRGCRRARSRSSRDASRSGHAVPHCHRCQKAFRDGRGMKLPRFRRVGRRAVDQARARFELDVESSEGSDQAVTRRLAHRLLACPVTEKTRSARIGRKLRDGRLLARGEEFACEPIEADAAVTALDVDPDAEMAWITEGNADERHTVGMRNIEIERDARVDQFRATANAPADCNCSGSDAQRVAKDEAQRGATRDPAAP